MEIYSLAGLSFVGIVLFVLGAAMVIKAVQTKNLMRRALLSEDVSTPMAGGAWRERGGAVQEGAELISDARTAWLRAEQIKSSTNAGGTFQSFEDGSPERARFLEGLGIRTTLYLVIASFGIANLAMATGGALMLLGGATIALGIPLTWDYFRY